MPKKQTGAENGATQDDPASTPAIPETDTAGTGKRLLLPGRSIVISGKVFKRDKFGTEKNIKKNNYVPESLIEASKIDLKHFEK